MQGKIKVYESKQDEFVNNRREDTRKKFPRHRNRESDESVIHVLGSNFEQPGMPEDISKYEMGYGAPMNKYPPPMPTYGINPFDRDRGYPPNPGEREMVRKDMYHVKTTERDPREQGGRENVGGNINREPISRDTTNRSRRRSSSKERRRSRDREYDSRRNYKRSRSKSKGKEEDRSSKRSRH